MTVTDCTTVVVEEFPVAVAVPVTMRAVPADWFVAVPLVETTPPLPLVAVCSTAALFDEVLPTAALRPVLAAPSPAFTTELRSTM